MEFARDWNTTGLQAFDKEWLSTAQVSLVHSSKGEMRQRYWGEGQGHVIGPLDYPALFMEWLEVASHELTHREGEEVSVTIFQRANTIDLLLQAQRMSPSEIPLLNGETYVLIRNALIPRILYPAKRSPHESTTILNVYFGNQTLEATETTTIG